MKATISTTVSKQFLKLMLDAAKKVKKDKAMKAQIENFPAFIVFFSKNKPQSFYFDLTPYAHIKDGGIYVRRVPRLETKTN